MTGMCTDDVPPHAVVAVHAVDRDGEGQVDVGGCVAVSPHLIGRRAEDAHAQLHDEHNGDLQVDEAVKAACGVSRFVRAAQQQKMCSKPVVNQKTQNNHWRSWIDTVVFLVHTHLLPTANRSQHMMCASTITASVIPHITLSELTLYN